MMRLLKNLMAFAAFVALMTACRKEKSLEEGNIIPPNVQHQWEFQESASHYQGKMDSAYIQSDATSSIVTITGTDSSGDGQIVLQMVADKITIGKYSNAQSFFQYLESDAIVYQNEPSQPDQFSISIVAIDSVNITGTFSGTVKDGQGNARVITEGKFTAPLSKEVVYVPPTGPGQLTLWAKQLCSEGGNIKISVADQTGEITGISASPPACGATGTATFTLPAGPYTVTAICGSDTLRYGVNVIENDCITQEVEFVKPPVSGDYLPLTQGNYWSYADLSNSVNTNTITARGLEELDYRQYTQLVGTGEDTTYYRKEGSTYYQYRKLDFQDNIADPPSIDIVILHDDYSTGQLWETPSIAITVQSIPIHVKLQSIIVNRDFQASFGGTNYSDLIEVKTMLFISLDGGANFSDSGSYFSTVFAKGIGIVYNGDLKTQTEWGITGYHVIP